LIALSACLRGEVAAALAVEKHDLARASADRLRDIFGKDNFFLEVQDQGIEIQQSINRGLVRLGKESDIPLVATNDCRYLTKDDARAHEVLLCIQTGKTMSDPQRLKFATDQFYLKTAEEMAQVFAELPEALTRTVAIAERCNVKIGPVSNPFPEFQVPDGYTLESYFEKVVRDNFSQRVPHLEALAKAGRLSRPLAEYERRLTDEIRMIQQMRFSGYFLIVWDFMRYARAQGIPVGPGRGSYPASSFPTWGPPSDSPAQLTNVVGAGKFQVTTPANQSARRKIFPFALNRYPGRFLHLLNSRGLFFNCSKAYATRSALGKSGSVATEKQVDLLWCEIVRTNLQSTRKFLRPALSQ
jgi:hypothetical protein